MSRRPNTKTNKPLTIRYFPIYLFTYLLKSNPGNPVPATGYPVPNTVPTSNHYLQAYIRLLTAAAQGDRVFRALGTN